MGTRVYINDGEFSPQLMGENFFHELLRQGCDIDDEGHFSSFKLKEFMPMMEAIDRDVKVLMKSRMEEWREIQIFSHEVKEEKFLHELEWEHNPHFFDFSHEYLLPTLDMFLGEYVLPSEVIEHILKGKEEGERESILREGNFFKTPFSPSSLWVGMDILNRVEFLPVKVLLVCISSLERDEGKFLSWHIAQGREILISCY